MDSQHSEDARSPGGPVGIYGWRKRCLYLLIVVLVAVVIVNLSLTLWLLKVMQFSSEGMGRLKVVDDGLQLQGRAMVLDSLIASTIRSRPGTPISIDSSHNFSVNARDHLGRTVSRLILGSDQFECLARGFRVTDPKGEVLFSATRGEVEIRAETLRVTGGAVFDGSVQTPMVRADSGYELKLESPTRSLHVKAPQGVSIEARAGEISANCLSDMKLQSVAGTVRLEAANVFMPGLREASRGSGQSSRATQDVYQLCACANGRVFLAQPDVACAADSDVCR
ncbi:delta-sarcoglycan [Neocloeon triangulifer]|uniref:delta-sarcoglycan n=1 Tax=Neocloeon triangulifer TaxID=2078957 RepID=UPI00286FA750|nr:delta-sarcoglycan [Neocloeon triangulifer]